MEIKNFDKEFVERTKKIIENSLIVKNEYDITLLINCMLALVVLPIEKTSESNKKFQDEITNKLKEMDVVKKSTNEGSLFRAIKNALSHLHIEIKNKNGIIYKIIFRDKKHNKSECHTMLEFDTTQLKEFAVYVANQHLERLSNR